MEASSRQKCYFPNNNIFIECEVKRSELRTL